MSGLVQISDLSPFPRQQGATRSYHVMIKPVGAICNLDCTYCFYLHKEDLLGSTSKFQMSDEIMEAHIRQYIAHARVPEVTIAWQGGEPTLMGLDFFRRSVQIAERYLAPGQRALHTIQTNGTLIDAEWARFFAEHGWLVGISIDGPREIHDAYRVTKGGRGSFANVMRGLGHLRDAGVEFNALTTIHAANAGRGGEVYRFLRDDCGARFIQFIPIIERVAEATEDGTVPWTSWRDRPLYVQQGDRVTGRSVTPEQYGQFLIEVFDEWVRHDVGEVFVQVFDTALAHWMGLDQVGMCVHARTCGSAIALEHNGDVYSCDHYVEDGYLLGNLAGGRTLLELVTSPEQAAFGKAKLDTLPEYCRRCDVRFACNGGCPKDRFISTPDGEPGLNYLCAGYQRFFRHIDQPMRVMADLLRHGQDAAAVREWCAEDDLRVASSRANVAGPARGRGDGAAQKSPKRHST